MTGPRPGRTAPDWPEPTTGVPDEDTMTGWLVDSAADATDGCQVEPDGSCPHGHPSWLVRLGLI